MAVTDIIAYMIAQPLVLLWSIASLNIPVPLLVSVLDVVFFYYCSYCAAPTIILISRCPTEIKQSQHLV